MEGGESIFIDLLWPVFCAVVHMTRHRPAVFPESGTQPIVARGAFGIAQIPRPPHCNLL
jgi:hypothetical protein